jgi:hypothetical protein
MHYVILVYIQKDKVVHIRFNESNVKLERFLSQKHISLTTRYSILSMKLWGSFCAVKQNCRRYAQLSMVLSTLLKFYWNPTSCLTCKPSRIFLFKLWRPFCTSKAEHLCTTRDGTDHSCKVLLKYHQHFDLWKPDKVLFIALTNVLRAFGSIRVIVVDNRGYFLLQPYLKFNQFMLNVSFCLNR